MSDLTVDRGLRVLEGLSVPLLRRNDWGAVPAVDWPIEHAVLRGIVIHHTGTRNDDDDPLGMLRRVQRFHAEERGWGDIGYSFVVLEDGRIAEGRDGSADVVAPRGVVAGHAYGHNPGTLGVAVAGRFHDRCPTGAAWDALVDLLATIVIRCGLDATGRTVTLENGRRLPAVISGHRHAVDTSCPGDFLAGALPSLRAAVRDRTR